VRGVLAREPENEWVEDRALLDRCGAPRDPPPTLSPYRFLTHTLLLFLSLSLPLSLSLSLSLSLALALSHTAVRGG
jgi:hypothetical protein